MRSKGELKFHEPIPWWTYSVMTKWEKWFHEQRVAFKPNAPLRIIVFNKDILFFAICHYQIWVWFKNKPSGARRIGMTDGSPN